MAETDGHQANAQAVLTACPLCRTNLTEDSAQQAVCPACGAKLEAYTGFQSLAVRYHQLASELLSRGQTEQARQIIEQLPMISEIKQPVLDQLRAQLALQDGELPHALSLAKSLPTQSAQAVSSLAKQQGTQHQTGHELYNYALSSARRGDLRSAAWHLQQAVAYCPQEQPMWQLKLKVDLKLKDWAACYADLKRLDRLSARPAEFIRLEELLPPLSDLV